ncbi:MAG: cytochrome c [Proteobacteria bacterium]|jgi:cytochrome c55X|nr:cytochrome c [Pseudomonadota bacterium]MCG6935180.1 cytochrome c [Pseudomonadota bacterium]
MARGLVVTGLLFVALSVSADEVSAPRRDELRNLLLQDCGSCHGMTMKGGLGPALTPQALQGKDREMLVVTILQGRPGTPMPPWQGMLSRADVEWLVDSLYQGVTP